MSNDSGPVEAGDFAISTDIQYEGKPEPAPAPEPDNAGPTADGADAAPKQDKEPKEDKTPGWLKREIAKEREQRRVAEARAQQLEERLRTLETGPSPGQNTPPSQRQAPADEAPNWEDYSGDEQAYWRDMTRYEARQEIRQELEARQQREAEAARASRMREQADRVAEVIPDFRDTLSAASPLIGAIPRGVAEEIANSDLGALVTYELASHPDGLEQLVRLPERQQLRIVWTLENSLRERMRQAQGQPDTAPEPPREPERVTVPETWKRGSAGSVAGLESARKKLDSSGDASDYLAELHRERKKAGKR